MTEHTSNPMPEARPDASATSDARPTPPALTAAQMADTAALASRLVADIVSHLKAGMSLDTMERLNPEYRLALALTTAQARIEAVERERDNWQETAAQHCRNEEFWRGLVHQTGAHFGPAAYTADDGSVGDRVLGLKVPELAQAAVAERDALEARVGFLEGEAERAWQSFSNETTRAEQAEAVREEAQELLGEARARIEALEGLNRTWGERMLQSIDASWPGMTRAMTDPSLTLQDYISDLRADLTAARTRAEGLEAENERLRMLLCLRHHATAAGLYLDDGELQCAACGIDFKRMSAEDIERRFTENGRRELAAITPPPATTGEEPTR